MTSKERNEGKRDKTKVKMCNTLLGLYFSDCIRPLTSISSHVLNFFFNTSKSKKGGLLHIYFLFVMLLLCWSYYVSCNTL